MVFPFLCVSFLADDFESAGVVGSVLLRFRGCFYFILFSYVGNGTV